VPTNKLNFAGKQAILKPEDHEFEADNDGSSLLRGP